jgi:hypothetical protein
MNLFHRSGPILLARGDFPGRDDQPSATTESEFAVDPRANATRYADNEQAK